MEKRMKDNKGFTLVELIIVIAIIAILLALITPNLTAFLGTAEETAAKANAKTAYTSAFAWATGQKAKSVAVSGTVVLKSSGSAITIDSNTTGIANDKLELGSYFTASEIPTTAKITIEFSDNAVTKVSWDDNGDGTAEATYPETPTAGGAGGAGGDAS